MAYRARNILIAVALAAVAALLTSFYVTSYKRHVQRGEDHVTVLVAKKDISEGMTGAEAAGMLSPLEVPRRSVVPGAISNPDQIAGLVATQPTLEGEQVTTRRFSPVSENGVRADLKGTLRAFQLQGDTNQTLAGTLRDGDHVDVVATFKYPDGCVTCIHITRTVLRNLKVLNAPDVPAASGKLTNNLQNDYSVMLAVTDRQAQKLSFTEVVADNDGGWKLTLRPVVHGDDSPESVSGLNGPTGIAHEGLNGGQFDAATGGH
jgi:Flp pilus assembly protein CpaB